jgi:hypothetical protein
MIPTAPTPNALLLPESLKRGSRQIERINSILDLAEPILGVDRAQGDKAWIRKQPGGMLFITKDPADTLFHVQNTPLAGKARYAWLPAEGGIRRGYLTEEARAERARAETADV